MNLNEHSPDQKGLHPSGEEHLEEQMVMLKMHPLWLGAVQIGTLTPR